LKDTLQLKSGLTESKNKSTISSIQQEKAQQNEKSKQLKEKLSKLELQLEENTNNDLNYDSTESVNSGENNINYDTEIDDGNDDNSDFNYDSECSDDQQDTNHNGIKNTPQDTNK
jgi:predicted nuclease with TOPRIM domain